MSSHIVWRGDDDRGFIPDDPEAKSPWERAQEQGPEALRRFEESTKAFYERYPTGEVPPEDPDADTNWLDPNTWPAPQPGGWPQPPMATPTPTTNPEACPPGFHWDHGNRRCVRDTPTTIQPTSRPTDPRVLPSGFSTDPRVLPSGFSSFTDPYTKQYEGLLQAQLELLRLQQEEMRRKAEEAQRRRAEAEGAWRRFEGVATSRAARLQQPAYTGAEAEVLRTQLLDPLERDRTAAQKRALEQISARGFLPTSGIGQELIRQVDRAFDEQRTTGQRVLAERQIMEQRSREQEAQQLLGMLAQMPDAIARGDLDFVNYVQGLIAAPGTQSIAIGDILAELPSRRLRDALSVLGAAPQNIGGTSQQAVQLLQLLQQQRALTQGQYANLFGNLGLQFQPR